MMKRILLFSALFFTLPVMAQNSQLPPSCPDSIPALGTCQPFQCDYQPTQALKTIKNVAAAADGKKPDVQQQGILKQMVFHRDVQLIADGMCKFTDSSGGTPTTCTLNKQQRVDLANFIQKTDRARTLEKIKAVDKDSKPVIKLDGQVIPDVYAELMKNGACK